MNEIPFNSAGNVTREPELRYTTGGQPVTTVGLAVTPRRYDSDSRKWVDGTTTFIDATVWGDQATHVAESISVGDRVVVIGRLVTRTWTPESGDNAGKEQRRLEVVADEVGPSLRWATAKPTKASAAREHDEAPTPDEAPV